MKKRYNEMNYDRYLDQIAILVMFVGKRKIWMIMITKRNLANHEFTGMNVFVESGSMHDRMTHRGKILLETKNSFVIRQREKIKIFPKSSISSLRVEVEDGVCFIKGSTLLGNAEDRVFK